MPFSPLYLNELRRCHAIIEDLSEEFDGDWRAGVALWKKNIYSPYSSRLSYGDYCINQEIKREDRHDRESGLVWFY